MRKSCLESVALCQTLCSLTLVLPLLLMLQNERVLFHYNGHGVPRPTVNGEIWVFNARYTQYIPLSMYELQVRPA